MVNPYEEIGVPKYVIERQMPGIGEVSPDALQGIAHLSCSTIQELGSELQWVQSFVTPDKMYCIFNAPNIAIVREHAQRSGIPANQVSEVTSIIDPTTAEDRP